MIHAINAVIDANIGKLLEYRNLIKESNPSRWNESNCREVGRLCNSRTSDGIKVKVTKTITWLHPSQIPPGRKLTYLTV